MAPQPHLSKPDPSANGDTYEYDAFISYRHVNPDRQMAQWLHTQLERYRVPAKLVRDRGIAPRLRRVFRDEEELAASSDLNREIETALRKSRYLIVICSPRTPLSQWVYTEVERFREWKRDDRILAVLIEGSPRESFPRPLCEIRRTVVDASGNTAVSVEEIEPLAADLRPHANEGTGHIRKMARLRILACLLGCTFDELRQREQERQTRRLMIAGGFVAILAVLMTVLAVFAFTQKQEADEQRGIAVQKAKDEEEAKNKESKAKEDEKLAKEQEKLAKERAVQSLYFSDIQRAFDAWQRGNVAEAERILHACPEELRAWEWHYLMRLCHSELRTFSLDDRELFHATLSPDGKYLAACSNVNKAKRHVVQVWEVETGREVGLIDAHQDTVHSAAFSPDNTRLATAGSDGAIRVWEIATGKSLFTVEQAHGLDKSNKRLYAVQNIAFTPNGKLLFSKGSDHTVRFWQADDGKSTGSLKCVVDTVAFDPFGSLLALASTVDRTITVFDVVNNKTVHVFGPLPNLTGGLAFSRDGKRLAWGGSFGLVKVWDLTNGKQLLTFQGHRAFVSSVSFSPDSRRLVTASLDQTVRIWEVETGQEMLGVRGHSNGVSVAEFLPDGRRLMTASKDRTIKLWDVTADQTVRTLRVQEGDPYRVAFRPDGRVLASESGYTRRGEKNEETRFAEVILWDTATGRRERTLQATGGQTQRVLFSPNGRRIVTELKPAHESPRHDRVPDPAGRIRAVLQAYDPETGATAGKPTTLRREYAAGFSADGRRCAIVTAYDLTMYYSDSISEWFVPDGAWVTFFKKVNENLVVTTYSLSDLKNASELLNKNMVAGGRVIFNGQDVAREQFKAIPETFEHQVFLLDLETGQRVGADVKHHNGVAGAAFSSDGKLVSTAGLDGVVKLLDGTNGKELHTLVGHSGAVYAVAFSRDGTQLATAGKDGTVRTWSTIDGQPIAILKGYEWKNNPPILTFNAAGTHVAVFGNHDQPSKIWDVTREQPVLIIPGDSWLAFTPDGRRVVSSKRQVTFSANGHWLATTTSQFNTADADAKLWDVASGRLILPLYTPRGGASLVSEGTPGGGTRSVSVRDKEAICIWNAVPFAGTPKPD